MDKAVTIAGFARKAGAHLYVKFTNDGGGVRGTYNLTLNVHNGTGYTGAAPVYVGKYQCGIGAISAGCTYEMLFDGEHYVILNSDIVAQETSETASYIKKGNGLIKQWASNVKTEPSSSNRYVKFDIPFTRLPVLIVNQHADESGSVYYNEFGYNVTKEGFHIRHAENERRFIHYLAVGI